ncbi:MAG: hypothetical protein R2911_38560 [Caldilineaceae bacterium]
MLLGLLLCLSGAQDALAIDDPADVLFTPDTGGVDDEASGSDLNQLGFDTSHLSDADPYYGIVMSLDDTAYANGATANACSFLDGDDDGKADFALCATVGGNPAVLTAASNGAYVKLYDCRDNSFDSCIISGGGVSRGPIASDTDGDGRLDTDGAGNPIALDTNCTVVASSNPMTDDPFNGVGGHSGEQDPVKDTVVACQFFADEAKELDGNLFPSLNLTNACTFPYSQADSTAQDCAVDAGARFITLVKNIIGAPYDGTFTFLIDGATGADTTASVTTVNQTGATGPIVVGEGTTTAITYNISEDADPDWIPQGTPRCVNEVTGASRVASNTRIKSGGRWTCTFTNEHVFVPMPALALSKSAAPSTYSSINDTITYSYIVTNTGNVPLAGPVTVADDKIGTPNTVTCADVSTVGNGDGNLDVAESLTCTAAYAISQADLDNGSVTNTATASADGTASNQATATVAAVQNPHLALVKSGVLDITTAAPIDTANPGDQINYTLTATNDGNITLPHVEISDPMLGTLSCPAGQPATLAPTASLSCTGSYTLLQADIDAGQVLNAAQAVSPELATATANATVEIPRTYTLTLTKAGALNMTTIAPTNRADVGDHIEYTMIVTNTGNTTLHDMAISDPMLGALSCTPGQPVDLAPAATLTCSGGYALLQADIDAGQVDNTASAISTDTDPTTADATVIVPKAPNLSLSKAGVLDITGGTWADRADVGDQILYTLVATNTGNITLPNVTISDPKLSALTCVPAAGSTLAVGASMECSGSYTLTQVDIDAGQVDNTATAESPASPTAETSAAVSVPQIDHLALSKVGALDMTVTADAGRADVGDQINYTLVTTNTGNTTLSNVVISDGKLGALTCSAPNPVTLTLGQALACNGSYTLTQADIDAGAVENVAAADSDQTTARPITITTPVVRLPHVTLTKVGAVDPAIVAPIDRADIGDHIVYTLTAVNDGNVTLTNMTIADPVLGALACTPSTPAARAPGESIICTGSHVITQADIDADSFANTATASGMDPSATTVSDEKTISVSPGQVVNLALTKTTSTINYAAVNEVINYTLVTTNTGNTTLTAVSISDPKVDGLTCIPGQPTTLLPGQRLICTGSHTVLQSDLDAGQFDNTATAGGTGPQNQAASAQASKSIPAALSPHLSLSKTATEASYSALNQALHYTLVALNDGNGTLTDVSISDPKLGALTCSPAQPATLAPAESLTCTGAYAVAQADLDAGYVDNTADASGTDFQTTLRNALPASVRVPANQQPALRLTKRAQESSYNVVDQVLHYTLVVTNSGNVSLNAVQISDPQAAITSCAPNQPTTLAPGQALTCHSEYAITQADLDAGSFTNTASAQGVAPDNQPVTGGPSKATVPAALAPLLSLTKSAPENSFGSPGDGLHYTLLARNDGNTVLHNVAIVDAKLGALSCAPAQPATLSPGQTLTCAGEYTVTQADLDAGQVDNSAQATSNTAKGVPVNTPLVTFSVPAAQAPHLVFSKQVQEEIYDSLDDVLHFTLTARNDGNVTLFNAQISDPLLDALTCTPSQPLTLSPGQMLTCVGAHTIIQSDLDAGRLRNIATVSGADPQGELVSSAPAGVTVPANVTPQLSLQQRVAEANFQQVGDVLHFTLPAVNTGNVTLSNVSISASDLDGSVARSLANLTCNPAQPATLAPGAALVCTGQHVITQADLDAGSFQSTATAQASAPNGDPIDPPISSLSTHAVRPNLIVQKSAFLAADNVEPPGLSRGDLLRYVISMRNLGNGPALDVFFSDTPDGFTTPVAGSVSTSQGDIIKGNIAGDADVQVDVGDIQSGEVVTITFNVLINLEAPPDLQSVRNQAFVEMSNAVNLATNQNSIPSDDPAVDGPADPTITPVVAAPTALEEGEEPGPMLFNRFTYLPLIQTR